MSRIEIKNGRVSLKAFKHFMRMLDMVIVDESGNFLTMDDADKAVVEVGSTRRLVVSVSSPLC